MKFPAYVSRMGYPIIKFSELKATAPDLYAQFIRFLELGHHEDVSWQSYELVPETVQPWKTLLMNWWKERLETSPAQREDPQSQSLAFAETRKKLERQQREEAELFGVVPGEAERRAAQRQRDVVQPKPATPQPEQAPVEYLPNGNVRLPLGTTPSNRHSKEQLRDLDARERAARGRGGWHGGGRL